MKRAQIILLFMLIFCGAFLLGNIPSWAQGTTTITGVSIDGGRIVTDLSGQTPLNPCYNPNPTDPSSPCEPMVTVTEFWICDGYPDDDLSNCRPFNFSTLGAAYNCTILIGGRIVTIADRYCR